MKLVRKIAAGIGLVFIGLFEIAERAEFVKAHLPGWITMHSDLTIIAILIALCIYLLFSGEEKKQQIISSPTATATAEIGKFEQHIHHHAAPDVPWIPAARLHNVQCVGVKIEGSSVSICFQNVAIPGESIGNFREARLKITYRLESSREEIATVFPARWIGFDQDDIEIGIVTRCAVVAVFIGTWYAIGILGVPAEMGWKYEIERTALPSDNLIIEATLVGERNISLAPVTGILALGKDGSASFVRQD